MKYAVLVLMFLALALSPDASAQSNFRVAWQSTATGTTGHGVWIDKDHAFASAQAANRSFPTLWHWVQEKRRFLSIIPLPSKNIATVDVLASTAGMKTMKTGDAVRLRCFLSEWRADQLKEEESEDIYGEWMVFINGKTMEVFCVAEHDAR
jgi:hypothetical protein